MPHSRFLALFRSDEPHSNLYYDGFLYLMQRSSHFDAARLLHTTIFYLHHCIDIDNPRSSYYMTLHEVNPNKVFTPPIFSRMVS